MFHQIKLLIVGLSLLVLVPGRSIADAPTRVDNLYQNGSIFLLGGMPLSYFESRDMQQACTDLQAGRLTIAASAFSKKLQRDESDRAAWIGFLQSEPDYRTFYVEQLQRQEKNSPTQTNKFKLGVLVMYSLAHLRANTKRIITTDQMHNLWKLSYVNLHDVYQQDHDLLTGLCLDSLGGLLPLGYTATQYPTPTFEDLFRVCIGDREYNAFVQAKNNGWNSRVPAAPDLSSNKLRECSEFVGGLIANYATPPAVMTWITSTRNEIHEAPMTPEEARASKWLTQWKKEIDAAANQ